MKDRTNTILRPLKASSAQAVKILLNTEPIESPFAYVSGWFQAIYISRFCLGMV